ncbi:protease modulator HflC [Candidatus Binatia bacterium]|jgi:membrane protease subunit HflC|nr:protease modulator HflC [Candidatus Binatia bacterium]
MDRRWVAVVAVLVLLVAVWNTVFFTVPTWMQAVVLQLGEPVRTVREPGLYAKIPFIQTVMYFDRRLLEYDASPKELLTRDKQQLVVDNYTRWKIIDPLKYYQAVRDEAGAQSRLDDIIYSNLRENFGRQTLLEILSTKREELMTDITKKSDKATRDYGIEVVDVRVKRADLPEKNEQNVFGRMRTERERLAKKYRAEGDEEARKITSGAEKDVRVLLAEAQRDAEIARGQGDAEAVRIYADAYGRDPDFFSLTRTLEAYRRALPDSTSLVISPDTEFLRFLKGPASAAKPARAGQGAAPASPP